MKWTLIAVVMLLTLSSSGFPQSFPTVDHVVISVKDLGKSLDVYTTVMGFQVGARGETISPLLQNLWNIPLETQGRWVLLQHPTVPDSPRILLVQFTREAPRARYEYRDQDNGLMGLHICVHDVQAAYKTLVSKGFTAMSNPVVWRGGGGELGVGTRGWHEVFMHGLDGEEWVVIPADPGSPKASGGCPLAVDTAFSPIHDVILAVDSLDRSYTFYHGLFGWAQTMARWEAFGPDLETMLRMPVGSIARSEHLGYPDQPKVARWEPTQWVGMEKINIYDRGVPPYRGLIAVGIRVADAQKLYQIMEARGTRIVLQPVTIPDPPFHNAKVFSARDPDGVFLELIEANPTSAAGEK